MMNRRRQLLGMLCYSPLATPFLAKPASAPAATASEDPLRQRNAASVFDFLTPAQIADVLAGTQAQDLTTAIQTAVHASPTLFFPRGIYRVGAPILCRYDSRLNGENSVDTRLIGSHGGTILRFPVNNNMCQIERIYFGGRGCTAIDVDTSQTKQGLNGYLTRAVISRCHFAWELAFGINNSMNGCVIEQNQFGQVGEPHPASNRSFVAIRSVNVGQNTPNMNIVRENGIYNAGGSLLSPGTAVVFRNPTMLAFRDNDIEGCIGVLAVSGGGMVDFSGNWIERCGANAPGFGGQPGIPQIVLIEDDFATINFERNAIASSPTNGVKALVSWNGNANAPKFPGGFSFSHNSFGLTAGQYPFFNYRSSSYKLDPAGNISWFDNLVAGGNPANTLTAGLNYRGRGTPRVTAQIGGDGQVLRSTDPSLKASRSAPGLYRVVCGNPISLDAIGTSTVVTPRKTGNSVSGSADQVDQYSLIVTLVTEAGAPVDAAFGLIISVD